MTKYYIHLNAENAKTNTITRQATPEETKMYEELLSKVNSIRTIRGN